MDTISWLHAPVKEIIEKRPLLSDFFVSFNICTKNESKSFSQLVDSLPGTFYDDCGTSKHELTGMYVDFINGMNASEVQAKIESLDVLAGNNKSGNHETCDLHLVPGEITCIVGPTGSGKSRLLADIEWLANADTPTQRRVLINGNLPDENTINRFGGKLIAQITQNMNFVLDMDVHSFLMLHAQSRFMDNAEEVVNELINLANSLSGEEFSPSTPITFLSGGQSRALMIADVACIGQAPIVLIDEIENAGVNKKKALDLLVRQDKIVLIATHDPLLILLSDKRVVIKNGGMSKIVRTNKEEKAFYKALKKLDDTLQMTKDYFRSGNQLSSSDELTNTIWNY